MICFVFVFLSTKGGRRRRLFWKIVFFFKENIRKKGFFSLPFLSLGLNESKSVRSCCYRSVSCIIYGSVLSF